MDPSWQRMDSLFDRALDLPSAQRRAFIERECADEPDVRRKLERLLDRADRHDDERLPGGTTSALLLEALAGAKEEDPVSRVGTTVGNFRIVKELGRGGMAVVYLAERADGEFDQRVALKVIRCGAGSTTLLRRFAEERQILARISHANIARLYDGGQTDDGLPFFVMEQVDGLPIDRYCDEQTTTLDDRLELFLQVADGVAHAHRNLVVHRDIKASNILVTEDGGVKLLDFGIARHLEYDGSPVDAEAGSFLTPRWASPEQMRGEPVTTASDVYQLGLLLYRLLAGRLPEETPSPPGASADLDCIAMAALRERPEDRYASVAQLADDVRRFRAGLPVSARPATLAYRLRRLVGRHRLAAGFAVTALLTLVVFAATTLVQSRRIARERDRANLEAAAAEQVSDFLTGLFRVSDPSEALGNSITARELLDLGAGQIDAELADQPELGARLSITMGQVYQQLGLYDQAEPLLQRALDQRRETLGARHRDSLEAMGSLVALYFDQGRYDEAEPLCVSTLEAQREVIGPRDPQSLRTANVLANIHNNLGRYEEAETLYREVLQARRDVLGPDDSETVSSVFNLAALYWNQGRYDDAEPLFFETVAIRRRLFGVDHPDTLNSVNNLGNLHQRQQRYDDAEPLYLETLEARRRVLGHDHPKTLTSMHNLAALYQKQERLEDSERLYRETLEARRSALGEEHLKTLRTMNGLADLLTARGRLDEAATLFAAALEGQRRVLGRDHPETAVTMHNLACALRDRGEHERATELYEQSRELLEAKLGAGHPFVAQSVAEHAVLLRMTGADEAARALEQRYAAPE